MSRKEWLQGTVSKADSSRKNWDCRETRKALNGIHGHTQKPDEKQAQSYATKSQTHQDSQEESQEKQLWITRIMTTRMQMRHNEVNKK